MTVHEDQHRLVKFVIGATAFPARKGRRLVAQVVDRQNFEAKFATCLVKLVELRALDRSIITALPLDRPHHGVCIDANEGAHRGRAAKDRASASIVCTRPSTGRCCVGVLRLVALVLDFSCSRLRNTRANNAALK